MLVFSENFAYVLNERSQTLMLKCRNLQFVNEKACLFLVN